MEKSQGRNSDSFTKGETLPLNPDKELTTTPLKEKMTTEELIESLASDEATAKQYKMSYPAGNTYILNDQHEAFKKLFGLKEGDEPFTPNMPKEVLQALQTAQGKPFKVSSKDFYYGLTEGYAPYLKQTLENPDAIFQDEFFTYLIYKTLRVKYLSLGLKMGITTHNPLFCGPHGG
ncbi:hypothetical protein [Helicobacter felis]|uniref:hypothetical protein n=1 Tax=Helicobacter felis TaxID=214 RepID=UPI000CF12CBE|nr:hypothetical protein [Helicobacter felis]